MREYLFAISTSPQCRRADIFTIVILALVFSSCRDTGSDNINSSIIKETDYTDVPEYEDSTADISNNVSIDNEKSLIDVTISVGNQVFEAKFYNNKSVQTIVSQMPFNVEMDDYASQEKVTNLSFSLPPAQSEIPNEIHAGDIYLWSGNSLVLFYTTFSNAYSYVPVGYIVDVTNLTDALGKDSVSVFFQIPK